MEKFRNFIILFFATSIGTGYFPFASGTISALLVGFPIYWLIKENIFIYFLIIFFLIILGCFTSHKAEQILKEKDSKKITIDEVVGLLIAFWGISINIKLLLLGFLINRGLDIIKPFPINKTQKFPGGIGIMADDILAGIVSNIILKIISINLL
ncbi:MAG: phosphatidylglycerophosphatase A [bacterium]